MATGRHRPASTSKSMVSMSPAALPCPTPAAGTPSSGSASWAYRSPPAGMSSKSSRTSSTSTSTQFKFCGTETNSILSYGEPIEPTTLELKELSLAIDTPDGMAGAGPRRAQAIGKDYLRAYLSLPVLHDEVHTLSLDAG